jgi:ribose transport system ATP-binding protein
MTFALQAKDIRKSFGGVEVLHGVDLEAIGGSVLALLGENGAGKSTLVKIIAGDYTADGGEIIVDDTSYPTLTPIAARDLGVAIIFQEFQDAPTLTVAENISLGRLPNKLGMVDWPEVNRRAKRILKELDVDIEPSRPVSTLRVGERQIIEIARALSRKARLLILDEPTASLDEKEVAELSASCASFVPKAWR